jgi:hypothetical protein
MREGNAAEGSGINVARGAWVRAIKFHDDVQCVDISIDYPGVIADVVALPFNKVLQVVPTHACVQYGLYLAFLFAFYKNWWGRGFLTLADDRVRGSQSELNNREDWVQSGRT